MNSRFFGNNGIWVYSAHINMDDRRQIECYRRYPGHLFANRQSRLIYGDQNGRIVNSYREAREIGLDTGYLQPHSRNLLSFQQSRAARKRGHVSTHPAYVRRQAEWFGVA